MTFSKVLLTVSLIFLTLLLLWAAVTLHLERIEEPTELTIGGLILTWPLLLFLLIDLETFGRILVLMGIVLNIVWLYILSSTFILIAKKCLRDRRSRYLSMAIHVELDRRNGNDINESGSERW